MSSRVPPVGIEPYMFSTPIGYFISASTRLGFINYLNRASIPNANEEHLIRSGGVV